MNCLLSSQPPAVLLVLLDAFLDAEEDEEVDRCLRTEDESLTVAAISI